MGKPKASSIDVPDPLEIINAEKEANRFDTSGPFGDTSWQGNRQTTSLSPEMQALQSKMFGQAMQGSQMFEMPDFVQQIAGGVANRAGDIYGVSKPQPGSAPPPMPSMPAPPPPSQAPSPMPYQPPPVGPDPNGPNMREPMPGPMPGSPPPGIGGPGMGVDPNQDQQMRNLLRAYDNMRFQVTRR